MNCEDARVLLHAYLDDELDVARSLEMARHLAGCAACRQRYEHYAQLQTDLRGADLYRPAPAALRVRISAQLPSGAVGLRPLPRRWRSAIAALAAMLVLAVTFASWQTLQLRRQGSEALVAEAVSGHLRSLLAGHLIDVRTSDQHTVKPWFDGRLDFSPQVKDLAANGFELIGGRLDVLHGQRVAALVYRRRLHVINLFEWPATAAAASDVEHTRAGYHVIQWSDAGMRYVAVSNLNDVELDAFVRAFRDTASISAPAAH